MADLRHRAATTDDLTGLPNRRALYAEASARLDDPRRRARALLMLDLNKFKDVNDSLGHHAGDLLLVRVGVLLAEQLRAGDVLARLGGDEFAVLLGDAGHEQAADVAAKLCGALAQSFVLDGVALHTSVSIGIALFPDDGTDLSELLRKADIAMYKAKTSGRGHCFYDDANDIHQTNRTSRLQTVEELRTALTNDQFILHYQPKVELDTGEVHAVEALVRWEHPTRGLLYPDAFLNVIEESGLMPSLTRVVLALALDQAALWQVQGPQLSVAVNLSGSSLTDTELPDLVFSMLAARGVSPRALQLEITEDFLMADHDRARAILTRLRRKDIQISIDDYGTGYSSLSYLRDLPIDELKLDYSFIFPMADDARALALVASTIGLAHTLGLRMVAEGVETHVAYTELVRLGCDQAQGDYMSKPVPVAELEQWLISRHSAGTLTDIHQLRPCPAERRVRHG
jgi:diguanylate cyclase (GGDEF)-like protein